MVGVQDVDEVGVERVEIIEAWEAIEDLGQLFIKRRRGEFNLVRIELTETRDGPIFVTNSWGLTLGFGKGNVDQVCGCETGGEDKSECWMGWWEYLDRGDVGSQAQINIPFAVGTVMIVLKL